MEISKVPFGTYKGDPVTKYILTNDNGVQVGILDFAITKSNKMKVKMLFMVELMVFTVTFGMLIARKQLMILFPSLLV